MTHINQRRDLSTNWASANPVLQLGEVGWEMDTRKSKLGDGVTAWVDLPYTVSAVSGTKADVGLGQVDNTSDMDKPISTATQSALDAKAALASPTFTGDPKAPTPATADNDTSIATTAFVKAAMLAANPVGSIKMSSTNVNPGTYLGGTWVAWGSGRVPVGVDTSQTEFDTAEETGGEKTHVLTVPEMPSHNHGSPSGGFLTDGGTTYFANASATNRMTPVSTTASAGGGGAHNNLQPYITCYMWKRTA